MASWEQESAMAVFEQVRQFVLLSGGKTTRLSREQKGRFVAICWIAQIYKYFAQPKASYVDDGENCLTGKEKLTLLFLRQWSKLSWQK
jgi:hypothetical protein